MAKIMKDGKPSTSFSRQDREWVKAMGGGGGGVTVEPLTVTENGTYTAEEGKAYSPVTVNVASEEATIEYVEVTNVLPAGKTMHHFKYNAFFEDPENPNDYIECIGENVIAYPFLPGQPTYIQPDFGESGAGDHLVVSNVAVTGDIEADGTLITIRGEGTITLTWVIG